uniref:Protein CNPPD1 n=1 Tax=Timema genevievae TaxID=629358 RepID=A0A7R9JVY3_TIMGE|nr:unnamed protein product [Timema genevievae]
MPAFSTNSKRRRDNTKSKFKVMGNHDEFLSRIKKTLYYGKLPMTERFSLPVSELASELFSEVKNGHSLDYLHLNEAATFSRNACVSPCSLVLALLYLERLKTCNPEYLRTVASSELFLVSMMVASKFLNDDGEEDEVFNDEWAASAGISVKDINQIEREFLQAITNVALQEGKRRGWFSYTDLDQLLETVDLAALAQVVVVVSAVCLTSYTASVLTLLGSVFAVSHMPGTSLSPRLPLQPATTQCSSSFDSLDELTSKDCATQTVTPVDVLTTSFILASISSSNHNQSEAVDSLELFALIKSPSGRVSVADKSYG